MADESDLRSRDFTPCTVKAKTLNIAHADPYGRGPFCRLIVEDSAPERPGVYSWVADGPASSDRLVSYVGEAHELRQITQGQRMNRAYNDYTYIPASQVLRPSDPRVRVNGLLNGVLAAGGTVSWWWLEIESEAKAKQLESQLIHEWRPPWNRAYPIG